MGKFHEMVKNSTKLECKSYCINFSELGLHGKSRDGFVI